MVDHQALLFLPDALHDAGVRFVELTGWRSNQPRYYWTDRQGNHHGYTGNPVGWGWHHTATTGFTPYVKNSKGQTKANLWIGLQRGNRLYATGNGEPTIAIASSGPGNFTAGKGKRWVMSSYVAQDRRFHGPQREPDDTPNWFGNRYYGSTETIHPGNGTALHPGVWEMQLQLAVILSEHFGWSAWRHIGHLDHTRRKVDPRFQQGAPYTIGLMQDQVQALLSEEDDMNHRKIIDLIGEEELEALRLARRWNGETAYYFDGRSDAVAGANQNLVEHLIASDQVASLPSSWTIREGDGIGDPLKCVKWAQAALNGFRRENGRDPISVDGEFGPNTKAATVDYQRAAQFNKLAEFDPSNLGQIDGVTATYIGRFHPEADHVPPGVLVPHGSDMHTDAYAALPHGSGAHTDAATSHGSEAHTEPYAAKDHADTHKIV